MTNSLCMKNCLLCQKEFVVSKPCLQNRQKYCSKNCRERHWAANNREHLNKLVREYRSRRYKAEGCWRETGPKVVALRDWMLELKSKPCTDCGNCFEICCMDFDHIEGSVKTYNVGSMFAHHYSRELIETELVKCELVCANCHRIRTRDRRTGSGQRGIKNKESE